MRSRLLHRKAVGMPILKSLLGASLILASLTLPVWAADTTPAELQQLEQRVAQEPNNPDAHFDLAMGLARTVKLEDGYAELKKVIALDPDYADKVIAKYTPMVQANKQNVEAFFRLAFGYYFKGLMAQQASDSLAVTDPAKAKAASDEAVQDKEQAKQAFKSIIANDPKYVWGYNYLGYLLFEDGHINKAMAQWNKADSIEDNAVAHFMLGQAFIKQGDMKDAVPEITRAMQLRGLNP